jgi:protein arginine kinase activator
MNCERCGQREAAVKYIEVEEGVKRSRWLCEVCATEEGAQAPPPGPVPDDVAASLQVFMSGEGEPPVEPCPLCGVEIQQLHDQGLLGCPHCYAHFRDQVLPLLRRYHGATVHLGKAPGARGPRAALRLEIRQLRSSLEEAVAAESFEQAAVLRDRISELQEALGAVVDDPDPEARP